MIARVVSVAAALPPALLGARVFARMARTRRGVRVAPASAVLPREERTTVIVPVLNERARLAPCLDGLTAQGEEVAEIIVVDGGSDDGTQRLVDAYGAKDPRVRLVSAYPVPAGWNGKAWGLETGLRRADAASQWILTIDADVRPAPLLARSLLWRARRDGIAALSVATLQEVRGLSLGLVHPALLATLVYRFGIPGQVGRSLADVQANGQCFLVRRDALDACGGFHGVRASRCEDVTLARLLVAAGFPVGFYETEGLVTVEMYRDGRDAWRSWPRSLTLRDRFWGIRGVLGLCEVTLVQALPLPAFALLWGARRSVGLRAQPLLVVCGILALARVGVLCGTRRAYRHPPWSYWLSPLLDVPVAIRLWTSAARSRHRWKGRELVVGDSA